MRIDHVTFAGPSLLDMREAFTRLGMTPDHGGVHSNGVTHMDVIGFADGSYIELISTLQPGQLSPWWHNQIAGDAGPCGVAVRCEAVQAECDRLRSIGVAVRGPFDMARRTPRGGVAEWSLAFVGEGEPGAMLPFIIADHTPRAVRVMPSASVRDSELTGVAYVVLAVVAFEAAVDRFRNAYGLPKPDVEDHAMFDGRSAHWRDGAPYVIVEATSDGHLRRRVEQFGDGPCAFLLKSRDMHATCRQRAITHRTNWCGGEVAWLDLGPGHTMQLGVTSVA